MKLQHQTWPEVEAYLKSKTGIIIPCGSTEQHGPVGMIGTDAICAEAVAIRVGDTAKACAWSKALIRLFFVLG